MAFLLFHHFDDLDKKINFLKMPLTTLVLKDSTITIVLLHYLLWLACLSLEVTDSVSWTTVYLVRAASGILKSTAAPVTCNQFAAGNPRVVQ